MDRGAWWATVHGVTKSRTRLSDFTFILLPLRRSLSLEAELPGEFQVVLTLLLASVLFPDVWPCGWTGVLGWLTKSWLWIPKTVASQRSPDGLEPPFECPQQSRICSAMLARPRGLVTVPLSGLHSPSFPHSGVRSLHVTSPRLCSTHGSACLTSPVYEHPDGSCYTPPDSVPDNS